MTHCGRITPFRCHSEPGAEGDGRVIGDGFHGVSFFLPLVTDSSSLQRSSPARPAGCPGRARNDTLRWLIRYAGGKISCNPRWHSLQPICGLDTAWSVCRQKAVTFTRRPSPSNPEVASPRRVIFGQALSARIEGTGQSLHRGGVHPPLGPSRRHSNQDRPR